MTRRGFPIPTGSVRERLGLTERAPYPHGLVDAARRGRLGRKAERAVYLGWELARLMEGASDRDREALVVLVVASFASLEEGSTRLYLPAVPDRLRALGADEELGRRARALVERLDPEGPASCVVGGPEDGGPLVREGDYLYHQRVHQQERELGSSVRARLGAKAERSAFTSVLDALDAVLARRAVIRGKPIRLSTEQQQAIRTALTRPLTLISGGPGAGKTVIVASILRVAARLGIPMEDVALVAPTAWEARRLEESIREHLGAIAEPEPVDRVLTRVIPEPLTLERSRAVPSPFAKSLVLVDDASRLDLESMARLFDSLGSETKLVLLGDPDQLPTGMAGGIFRDLLERTDAAVQLSENHDPEPDGAARNIFLVARHVLRVNAEILFHPDGRPNEGIAVRRSAAEVRLEGVELLEADPGSFLDRWYRERVLVGGKDPGVSFTRLHRQRVLTATESGRDEWNDRLDRGQPSQPVIALSNGSALSPGDPGIVFGGNYFFPCRQGFFRWDAALGAPDVRVAHAATVEESLGSELDHVVLDLPEPDHPLLVRGLLYSALTRARRSVTILGSKEAVVAAIGRSLERSTGVGAAMERLS
jgi:exodeoxyribonuclease V alpha subunit